MGFQKKGQSSIADVSYMFAHSQTQTSVKPFPKPFKLACCHRKVQKLRTVAQINHWVITISDIEQFITQYLVMWCSAMACLPRGASSSSRQSELESQTRMGRFSSKHSVLGNITQPIWPGKPYSYIFSGSFSAVEIFANILNYVKLI